MSVSYRSLIDSSAATQTLVECVRDWMEEYGVPPFRGDELVTEGAGWIVTRRHLQSAAGGMVELVASNEQFGVRCVAQEMSAPRGRMLLIEEDVREAEAPGAPLPEPSPFVQRLLDAVGVDVALCDSAQPIVILVGSEDRHSTTLSHLQRRVRGMASVIIRALDEAQQLVTPDLSLSDGTLVLLRPGAQPIVLPAMWVRGNSLPAARRVQRDVLGHRLSEVLPPEFRQAILDLHRAGRGVDEWAEEADRLDRELKRTKDDLEYSLLVSDDALAELDRVQRRVAFLEREFRHRGEVVYQEDEGEYPDDVNLSVDAMKYAAELLEGLVFSAGAADRCAELDEQHSAPITAKRAWRALRALNDYARVKLAEEWNGNFLQYCRETPPGCSTFPPDDVALTESEGTLGNGRCREARMFPVPAVVDPAGVVLMDKHVKVAGRGVLTARLHFHDDTGGATRKVHVGYFGPHLPLP